MNVLFWATCGLGIAALAYLAYEYWPRSPRGRFLHEQAKLQRDMERRGLTVAQQHQEFMFRYYMVEFRDELSTAVLADPSSYREKMAKIAAEKAKTIALTDTDTAKRFIKVIDSSRLSDILNPKALAALDIWLAAEARTSEPSDAVYAKAAAAARTKT